MFLANAVTCYPPGMHRPPSCPGPLGQPCSHGLSPRHVPLCCGEIYRNPRFTFICMILYLMSFSPLDCKTPGGWGRHVSLPAVLSSCSLWAWEPKVLSLPVRPRLAPRAVYSTLPGSLGQKCLGPAPLLVSSLHGPLPTGLCQCFRLKLSFLLFPRVNGLL